eukprot:TRINITY_DN4432_c0_g1_i1.p1 TRINITY_DN4432_c0_g1~~TRINITY_DN4432_c0_g1_i1.p1  ORF type:complete len:287 (+),score=-11.10 TRINITY_DN4432_c0_g1_i1:139-999(+)
MNMNIVTGNYGKTLEWLRNHDLIPRNPTCCQKEMRLNTSTQRGDVYYWRCLVCRSVRNIRGSTWFGNHPLIPLMALTRIVFYYFANEINAKKTQELLKKEIGCELSIMTIREIYNEVRIKIISYYDVMWVSEKLGIPNAIEMDESLFSHLKLKFNGQIISGDGEEEEEGKEVKKVNSKGRIQIWVIGMIERTTLNIRVFSVKKGLQKSQMEFAWTTFHLGQQFILICGEATPTQQIQATTTYQQTKALVLQVVQLQRIEQKVYGVSQRIMPIYTRKEFQHHRAITT